MSLIKVANLLIDIPIRRVENGDELIRSANLELGEEKFNRNMNGNDLLTIYNTLTTEQKTTIDNVFDLHDQEIGELIKEVFRIKENESVDLMDTKRDSLIMTTGFFLSMFFMAVGLLALSIIFYNVAMAHDIPKGHVFGIFKAMWNYFVGQSLEVP